MKKQILLLFAFICCFHLQAQDTFSIVAVDSVTGEVGSAGASFVDLFQASVPSGDFLGQLIPGVGAINTQAYYSAANQNNATNRMNMGDTPNQIITWLTTNDVQSQPEIRQYGITAMVNGSPQSAAYTGSATFSYTGHILGPNYAIQGNILLGQEVLDSMEARFLNEPGDLACKLMAAMQGANMVGADTRCASNGTSSLFAYVKVAQPNDNFGNPSFLVSVRTNNNAGIEPIDSLQTLFDQAHGCNAIGLEESENFDQFFSVYPNPASESLTVDNHTPAKHTLYLTDLKGKVLFQSTLDQTQKVDLSRYARGVYFLQLTNGKSRFVKKVVVD